MTIKQKNVDGNKFILIEVFDLSEAFEKSRKQLQKEFQCLLTNALSHERLTPLNSIINLNEISEFKLNMLEYSLKEQSKGKKFLD